MINLPTNPKVQPCKPQHWEAHVKAFTKSGLSRAEYCRQHNLSYHAMIYWQRKLSIKPKRKETTLVPITIGHNMEQHSGQSDNAALKIVLPNQFSIEVGDNFSPLTLSRLLATLERR